MFLRIYTDGSCLGNPGPGGWSAIFALERKVKFISGGENNVTNNRMELYAVYKALKKIKKLRNYKGVNIHSDSAYVVNNMLNSMDKWKKNKWKTLSGDAIKNVDLWKKILALQNLLNSEGKIIKVTKVKGHSGDVMNELADKKAKSEAIKIKEIS
jgi:Ribonuclease HI